MHVLKSVNGGALWCYLSVYVHMHGHADHWSNSRQIQMGCCTPLVWKGVQVGPEKYGVVRCPAGIHCSSLTAACRRGIRRG
jgi:hypothetical protein